LHDRKLEKCCREMSLDLKALSGSGADGVEDVLVSIEGLHLGFNGNLLNVSL
jgi:hypothetical protein